MKIIKVRNLIFGGFLGFFVASFCLGIKALAQEAAPTEEPNVPLETKEITEHILSQPLVKGPFTGETQNDLEEVYPLYISPLSDFKLDWEQGAKQSYAKGENFELKGKLSYMFKGKEEINKIKAQDCQGKDECAVLESPYQMPFFSDVGILAQIWRKDEANSATGDNLVDEFYVSQGGTLKENEPVPFSLNWKVPTEIQKGQYYASFFVNANKRFNLKGTPLVSFFPAATFDFDVTGDGQNGIAIDKGNITVNGKKYSYRQPAPAVDLIDGKINIETDLVNLDAKEEVTKVKYELSGWSQEDPKDIEKSSEETKIVAASGKEKLSYSFAPSSAGSVYNLKITATANSGKSISNVRFVVNDTSRGVFRFLGLAAKDNSYYPMICIMDAAWKGYFDGKVKLILTNEANKTIGAWEKEGKIIPNEKCFVVKSGDTALGKNAGLVKINGIIQNKDGKLADERTVIYKLGESIKEKSPAVSEKVIEKDSSTIWIILLLLIAVSLGIWAYSNKKKAR